MFDFEKPNIEIAEISEDNKYGRFVVEPLERGYGTTLGNSLRRIMLSSLPGAAVSAVKIKGVLHEFSSIPGVKSITYGGTDISDKQHGKFIVTAAGRSYETELWYKTGRVTTVN